MKKTIITIIIAVFYIPINSQSVSCGNLKWNKISKRYVRNETRRPYTGAFKGYCFARDEGTFYIGGKGHIVNASHNWNWFWKDSTIKDFLYYPIYIIGNLKEGKEIGVWKFYENHKLEVLVAESYFENGINEWRLSILASDGTIKYEEVFNKRPAELPKIHFRHNLRNKIRVKKLIRAEEKQQIRDSNIDQ
jgi:hypothetical protein